MSLKEDLKETARRLLAEQEQKIAQAYQNTPAKYRQFISILSQNKAIAGVEVDPDAEMRSLGLFTFNGKTYVTIKNPYITVDGRIQMFADAHQKPEGDRYKYSVSSNIDEIKAILKETGSRPPADYPMVVWVESELFGKFEGIARIFWDSKSDASRTNPLEVAQTSALGRALAQAGFGLIGTGIASAEEIINSNGDNENREKALGEPEPREAKQSAPRETPQPEPEQRAGTFKVTGTQEVSTRSGLVLKVTLVDTETGEVIEALATGNQMAIGNVVGAVKATLIKKGIYYVIQQYKQYEEEDPFGLLDIA